MILQACQVRAKEAHQLLPFVVRLGIVYYIYYRVTFRT